MKHARVILRRKPTALPSNALPSKCLLCLQPINRDEPVIARSNGEYWIATHLDCAQDAKQLGPLTRRLVQRGVIDPR